MQANSSKIEKFDLRHKTDPNPPRLNENNEIILTSFKINPKPMGINELRTPEQRFPAHPFKTPDHCLKLKYSRPGNNSLQDLIEDPEADSPDSDFFDFPKLDLKIEQTAPSKKKNRKNNNRARKLEAHPEWAFLEDRKVFSELQPNQPLGQFGKIDFDMNNFEIDLGTVQKKKNSIQFDLDCEFAKYHSNNIFSESETTPTKPVILMETRKGSEHFLAQSSKDLSLVIKNLEKKDYVTPLKTHKIKKKRSPPKIRSRPRKKNKKRNLEYFLENINLDNTSTSIANLDIFADDRPSLAESSGLTNNSSWNGLEPLNISDHRVHMIYSTPNNQISTQENRPFNELNVSNKNDFSGKSIIPSLGSGDSISDLRLEKLRSEMQTTVSKSSLTEGVNDLSICSTKNRVRKTSIFHKKKRQNDSQKKQEIYNPNVVVGYKTLQCFF